MAAEIDGLLDKAARSHRQQQQQQQPLAAYEPPKMKKKQQVDAVPSDMASQLQILPGKTVVIVLCYKRADYLQKTLDSVAAAFGFGELQIVISQDGSDASVAQVAAAFANKHGNSNGNGGNVLFKQWDRSSTAASPPLSTGTEYLAAHYRRVLDNVFQPSSSSSSSSSSTTANVNANAEYAILLEDDMILSYDFFYMMDILAPFLVDETEEIFCISSWNDNAFPHLRLQNDRFFRTHFFPGLGWMLHRSLWVNELSSKWPRNHYDHWLRADAQYKGRSCIVPQVSRNYNIGESGSASQSSDYHKWLKNIVYYGDNRDSKQMNGHASPSLVDFGDLSYLHKQTYEEQVLGPWMAAPSLVLYQSSTEFRSLSEKFGIWDHPRTHYDHCVVVNLLAAEGTKVLCDARLSTLIPESDRVRPSPGLKIVAAEAPGLSCNAACQQQQQQTFACSERDFIFLNNCQTLSEFFDCSNSRGCTKEWGPDIPNYAVSGNYAGWCLVTDVVSTCDAMHRDTRRLCPCTCTSTSTSTMLP